MATRLPIDDLLDELATPPEDGLNNESSISTLESSSNLDGINTGSTSTLDNSTTPIQRKRLLIKNLTSSSLKKRIVKPVNCKYCFRYRNGPQQLESHLKENEVCNLLYQREHRVRKD